MGKTSKYYDSPINQRLRELVNAKNIQPFSEVLGVSQDAVRQWTSGYVRPDIDRLGGIAGFFGVSSDWLLGLTESSTIDPTVRSVAEYTGLSDDAIEALHWYCKDQSAFPIGIDKQSITIDRQWEHHNPARHADSIDFLSTFICSLTVGGLLLSVTEYKAILSHYTRELLDGRHNTYNDWAKKYKVEGSRVVLSEQQTLDFLRLRINELLADIFDDYFSDAWQEYREAMRLRG